MLQSADNDEKSDEEQQSLVVHLLEKLQCALAGGDERCKSDNASDESYCKFSLRVSNEQHNSHQENHNADDEATLVSYCLTGSRDS